MIHFIFFIKFKKRTWDVENKYRANCEVAVMMAGFLNECTSSLPIFYVYLFWSGVRESLAAKSRHWSGPNLFHWNDNPPLMRSGHGILSFSNNIYIFGGYGPSGKFIIPNYIFPSSFLLGEFRQAIAMISTCLTHPPCCGQT